MKVALIFVVVLGSALTSSTLQAQSVVDPNASVVELRASCDVNGAVLENCFETTDSLTDWLWGGSPPPAGRASAPNSMDSVLVRIGPGDFAELDCSGVMNGWVSFEGAGRERTRFVNDDPNPQRQPDLANVCPGGITVRDCTGLSFGNLGVVGNASGAIWSGDGHSLWSDVDIVADDQGAPTCIGNAFAVAWYDLNGVGDSLHFFWNTRFVARSTAFVAKAFRGLASESWVYASDFLAEITGPSFQTAAIDVGGTADIRIFGSTVRALASASTVGPVYGMLVGSILHMHGGIVNVTAKGDGSAGPVSLFSISASSGAFVHTPETAFVFGVQDGRANATLTRIQNLAGVVQSPFLWPPGTVDPGIESTDGSDMFVKTDGGPNGDESILYLFDNDCPSPHWRSAADGSCL